MRLSSTTPFSMWIALWLAASVSSVSARSVSAGNHSSAANETGDTESCMARVLHLLPSTALRLSIQDTETVLSGLHNPIDQLNSANADTASLSAFLGGQQNADLLVQCLSGQLEQCRESPQCGDAGKCIFTRSLQGKGSYVCKCDDGHTGKFCQTVPPSCSGNPCQNGATCRQRGSSFHCHCPPLYIGTRCEEKWLDVAKFKQQSNTLNQISDDVSQLKHELRAGRRDDINRIDSYLQQLGAKILTNVNSTMNQMSSQVAALNERLNEVQENQEVSFLCQRTDSGPPGVFNGRTPTTRFTAYCDRETDGGGWIVFQRRQDGSVDFYRDWNAYKRGFGSASGEFWLGLDTLHYLTSQAGSTYELRIDMVFKTTGEKHYAKWSTFRVEGEANNYRLHVSGFSSPTLQDRMNYHNGQQFSTRDRDHDSWSGDCSNAYKGGWWYNTCHEINVNGLYGRSDGDATGVVYRQNVFKSLKFVEMKLRRRG
ncbi:angiopoietin-related protein 7-like isoform X1 [Sycon ciliatum]|uniref:angiopoietin-related protein 7-like isoform X1 n=1 Tax=Sycon ciliatum TaxID=27933 RepID=UPI0031F6BEE9